MSKEFSCKWALEAYRLMQVKPKKLSIRQAAKAHVRCNHLLYRLRCGHRRSTYRNVRQELRGYRTKLINRMYA